MRASDVTLPSFTGTFRSYVWGEDGLAGISDFFGNLCFCVALWNGKDPILKERLFGLGNPQGNHGEDVKELYYYLDNLPSHYYMQYLYKYPQQQFPYDQLREENRKRNRLDPEYEILDTGVFDDNQYFDVEITYAKQNAEISKTPIQVNRLNISLYRILEQLEDCKLFKAIFELGSLANESSLKNLLV